MAERRLAPRGRGVVRGGEADTIAAVASGAGGAIAIIRLSGPSSGPLVERLTSGILPAARQASVRSIRSLEGEVIDRGIVLWFPGPASYTGEDCAEFQLHAGPAILDATLDTLFRAGARAAEPGEFTRRAFLSGRVDLLQAEGIADLIAAETEEQRRQALAQTEGGLSATLRDWTERLRRFLVLEEARIDFPDETASGDGADERGEMTRLAAEFERLLEQGRAAERLRRGLTIVLAGEPNVGKSSLMNRLAGRDVAIVTPRAGTTRDRIETRTVIAGVPVTLIDTAGLREAEDEIEAEGIRRANEAAGEADLVLMVRRPGGDLDVAGAAADDRVLVVVNRIDEQPAPPGSLGVSATRGDNLDALRQCLHDRVRRLAHRADRPVATRARHVSAIEDARHALQDAARQNWPELRGEDLRRALASLGRLTGVVAVEDILGDIFSTFCIGK